MAVDSSFCQVTTFFVSIANFNFNLIFVIDAFPWHFFQPNLNLKLTLLFLSTCKQVASEEINVYAESFDYKKKQVEKTLNGVMCVEMKQRDFRSGFALISLNFTA